MQILNYHIKNVLNFDMLLKFNVTNFNGFSEINKIILSAKFDSNYKESLSLFFIILTFVRPKITFYKKTVLNLNIRAGSPAGIITVLRKKSIENFLIILLFEILPSLKRLPTFKIHRGLLQGQIRGITENEEFLEIQIYLPEVNTVDIVIYGKNLNKTFFTGCKLPI
jgi:ribosomal protein L5